VLAQPPAVWVTRPYAQAQGLAASLRARGYEPILAPLLEITPAVDESLARHWAEQLNHFAWVFFVSANAAQIGVAAIRRYRHWPPGPPVATVGASSAAALRALGFAEVWQPEGGAESEAVLAAPWSQSEQVAGRSLLIVKGEGGRSLLAETLRQRGADVHEWACYRRLPGTWSEAVGQVLAEGRLRAVLVTSSEAARLLPAIVEPQRLQYLCQYIPAVANHPRVAQTLAALGWQRIATAKKIGDAELIAQLETIDKEPGDERHF